MLKTINCLPNLKSPGGDGYTNELYKTFPPCLTTHLASVFNEAADKGSFPPEMLRAVIVTIPKPGKDPEYATNYRPISLLNVDIKIFAKSLACRLANLIPTMVYPDQVGFILGRQASDATRRLINLLENQGGSVECLFCYSP